MENYKNITSASSWLFEIIEINDSTKDLLDLVKYLLYKATGTNYGIKELDIEGLFSPKTTLVSVGDGDYIVNIDMSPSGIVIKDLETLKLAFSGYSRDEVLQQYAAFFLECQEKYRVNALFAAAVSITESSAGTNIAIGGNNMFSISNGGAGNWVGYNSMESSIVAFFDLISNHYFTNDQYTVDSIGRGNPVGSHVYCDPPDNWIKDTNGYMTQFLNAAGITITNTDSTETGAAIVEAARSRLGKPYVSGKEGPEAFDCSGLTQWCYKQVGIDIPRTSGDQASGATKKVSVSEARIGDILWTDGHVAIYIGDEQCIEAPTEGQKVKVSNIYQYKCALQYY